MNKKYLVLDRNLAKDYTLLVSLNEEGEVNMRTPQPFIVAFHFDESDYTWGQGHYFHNIQSAVEFLFS